MAAYVKAHELLSALPNPTDNDEKLKSQYSLNIAEAKRFSQNPRVSQLKIQKGSSPFDIAEEIIHSYRAKGEDGRVSSVSHSLVRWEVALTHALIGLGCSQLVAGTGVAPTSPRRPPADSFLGIYYK
jgi:hypothetical protein